MKNVKWVGALLAVAIAVTVLPVSGADDEEGGAKHTTKEVMQQAHKDGLLKKVQGGEATDEEKAQLLDLYVSLTENEAPKGDQASWEAKTSAVVVAAAKVVTGREGGIAELNEATKCAACHSAHKPG